MSAEPLARRRLGGVVRIVLGAIVSAGGVGGWLYVRSRPPGRLDPTDVAGYMRRLSWSATPDAARIKRTLATAASDLARERAAAHAEGIPLFLHELAGTPLSAAQNAAPLYRRLPGQRRAIALADHVRTGMTPLLAYNADELTEARRDIGRAASTLSIIRQAASLPDCDFQRDYSKGWETRFVELPDLRAAAELLHSSAYLMARNGRFREAVDELARGYTIARHTAAAPDTWSYGTAARIDHDTTRALGYLLAMAGPDAAVAEAVARAMERNPFPLDFRHALTGEVVAWCTAGFGWLRAHPGELTEVLGHCDDCGRQPAGRYTPDEQRFVRTLVSAVEARTLARRRVEMKLAGEPFPQRLEEFAKIARETDEQTDDPVAFLANLIGPVEHAPISEAYALAARRCLLAGCAVMQFRTHKGRWPARLSEAMAVPAVDPFTGGLLGYSSDGRDFVVYSVGVEHKFNGRLPKDRNEIRGEAYFLYPLPAPRRGYPLRDLSPREGGMSGGGMIPGGNATAGAGAAGT